MRIYLGGPMRGYKDFNFPAFFRYAKELREAGHEVFNPAERDVKKFGARKLKTKTGSEVEVGRRLGYTDPLALARSCFLTDTTYICKYADAVALMPGWKKSKGAVAERALGRAIGLKVIYLK